MGKIDIKQVKHIAKLANLNISDEELDQYSSQLGEVVDYIDELSQVDTDNVEPTSQTTGLINKTRKDETNEDRVLPAHDALSQTQKQIDNYFAVDMLLKEKNLS